MSGVRHAAATFGTIAASLHAGFHPANAFATACAGVTDRGADDALLTTESRTTQLEIGARLANFRAIHHQAEVLGLDMRSADFDAMGECGAQASLVATRACVDACLHVGGEGGMVIHI